MTLSELATKITIKTDQGPQFVEARDYRIGFRCQYRWRKFAPNFGFGLG